MSVDKCRASTEKLMEGLYTSLREVLHDCIIHEQRLPMKDRLSDTLNEIVGVHEARAREDAEDFALVAQESRAKLIEIRDCIDRTTDAFFYWLIESAAMVVGYYMDVA